MRPRNHEVCDSCDDGPWPSCSRNCPKLREAMQRDEREREAEEEDDE